MLKREIIRPPEHLFPREEWRIVERRWTQAYHGRAETVFALTNGYLGVRGAHEEGAPSVAPGTFVNGFHETWPIIHAEDAFGLARVGQTIVNIPDATTFTLYVDDEPFHLPTARLGHYERALDMRAGTLTRDLVWITPAGKHVRVRSTRLVSWLHRHVVAMSYEVELDQAAPVVIASQVRNLQDTYAEESVGPVRFDPRLPERFDHRVLESQLATAEGDTRLVLGYRTASSRMTLGIVVDHELHIASPHTVTSEVDPDLASTVVSVNAEPGVPIRIVKYASYQTSRRSPAAELVARSRRTIERVRAGGFDDLVKAQREQLDAFWDRADIVIEGGPSRVGLQAAIRWNLFQLGQASWRAESGGIPAKGLTGQAYGGHYFWDAETFVLPFLAYTQPRIAANLLRFRHSMLPKARERARMLRHRGAVFPWRTINGEEASAYFQAGTAQYHLNADIAYAVRRYVDVCGDDGLLREVGAELLIETARLWEDLGFYGTDGRFHIHGVTGPDEYTTVVNDNLYTNLLARLNLNYAASTVRRLWEEAPQDMAAVAHDVGLQPHEPDTWERAAQAMYVPYDEARGINPQDSTFLEREVWDLDNTPPEDFPLLLHYHPLQIYRYQVLKQADVVMAMLLVGNEFTLEQKRRNFEYYDRLTTGDSSLSAGVQSVVAAEIGNMDAAWRYFEFALLMDLADVAGNSSDGVHIASAAGAWMAIVFGFGGVRDYDGVLTIDPHLPAQWDALTFSLRFRGRQLRVRLGRDEERYAIDEGEPLEVTIRGKAYELTPDAALVLRPA